MRKRGEKKRKKAGEFGQRGTTHMHTPGGPHRRGRFDALLAGGVLAVVADIANGAPENKRGKERRRKETFEQRGTHTRAHAHTWWTTSKRALRLMPFLQAAFWL